MKRFVAGAIASLLLAGSANAASLAGDTVSIQLVANVSDYGTNAVLVGADGAGSDTDYFGNQFIDFNAGASGDHFTITSGGGFSGITGAGNVYWTLSNLDFGAPLVGFTILQSISPVTIDSLTANSVAFHYADGAISGRYFDAQFVTGSAGPGGVPEPATWALMMVGVGGLGAALRQRRKVVALAA